MNGTNRAAGLTRTPFQYRATPRTILNSSTEKLSSPSVSQSTIGARFALTPWHCHSGP